MSARRRAHASVSRLRARAGSGRLGCLFFLLLMAVVVYYGVDIGAAYLRYYRFRDAMSTEARFGARVPVDSIVYHLRAAADSLGLPPDAQRVHVRRTPSHIRLTADYDEVVAVPFGTRALHFTPIVERDF
ncbi:MAG TPA: hypothetical protein VFK13_00045 [Gemmatimonadaceae bacterium]|nr:hypothetical protein [Gemmatimonadaceae bacterium]